MALVNKDAARIVKDAEAMEKMIPEALALLRDPEAIASLEKHIGALALPDAARIIADEIYKLV